MKRMLNIKILIALNAVEASALKRAREDHRRYSEDKGPKHGDILDHTGRSTVYKASEMIKSLATLTSKHKQSV